MSAESLKKSLESFPAEQPSLFSSDVKSVPGSLNDEPVVRAIITESIRECSRSREQIVERMTFLLGEKVTVRMLNSYTSSAAEQSRWPAHFTRAFCEATGDNRLIRCIAERANFHVIDDTEAELLELGRQYLRRKAADESIALLEKRLHGRHL